MDLKVVKTEKGVMEPPQLVRQVATATLSALPHAALQSRKHHLLNKQRALQQTITLQRAFEKSEARCKMLLLELQERSGQETVAL